MSIRKHKWRNYVDIIQTCSNPECDDFKPLETHHIHPISRGGSDLFDNVIVLCEACHHIKDLHAGWTHWEEILHGWKEEIDQSIPAGAFRRRHMNTPCDGMGYYHK